MPLSVLVFIKSNFVFQIAKITSAYSTNSNCMQRQAFDGYDLRTFNSTHLEIFCHRKNFCNQRFYLFAWYLSRSWFMCLLIALLIFFVLTADFSNRFNKVTNFFKMKSYSFISNWDELKNSNWCISSFNKELIGSLD